MSILQILKMVLHLVYALPLVKWMTSKLSSRNKIEHLKMTKKEKMFLRLSL